MKTCREYITSDHCTETVILLADDSVKHAKKFDEHGDLYTGLFDDEILQLLCDAACVDNLDDVTKFTCGLDARGFCCPVLQQVPSTGPICVEDFNKALDVKDDELRCDAQRSGHGVMRRYCLRLSCRGYWGTGSFTRQ
ncbi:hypothetical protein SELMODRAFT_418243 [Selaginella moellendorffii]|uniref:Uncharacterized protein n=1 Tax=Selaginella moellendorffii TaxID=88036 RepID=D8S544_SELML|nr:hypothetical protein SELMODRAFT_418243 [Selaginella moellendorffii]